MLDDWAFPLTLVVILLVPLVVFEAHRRFRDRVGGARSPNYALFCGVLFSLLCGGAAVFIAVSEIDSLGMRWRRIVGLTGRWPWFILLAFGCGLGIWGTVVIARRTRASR